MTFWTRKRMKKNRKEIKSQLGESKVYRKPWSIKSHLLLFSLLIWIYLIVSPLVVMCCSAFGSLNLTTVKLSGVGTSFHKHTDAESKGIKAHFNMDESGVLLLDRVSSTFWSNQLVEHSHNQISLLKNSLRETVATCSTGKKHQHI